MEIFYIFIIIFSMFGFLIFTVIICFLIYFMMRKYQTNKLLNQSMKDKLLSNEEEISKKLIEKPIEEKNKEVDDKNVN